MKRILHSSSIYAFLITALLCGPSILFASNKAISSPNHLNNRSGFIENNGQVVDLKYKPNPDVLYLLKTRGFNVQLRASGWSYDVYQADPSDSLPLAIRHLQTANNKQRTANSFRFHRIDINLVGANPNCQLIPSDPLPDYLNYFKASCSTEGIRNVKQYSKVTYKNVYPDIDLEFFTNEEHGYKYNFVIRPGASVNDIRFKIAGPDDISFIHDSLKLGTRFGDLEELIPESFYLVNDSRFNISAKFKRINNEVYGLSVDKPVPGNALLIIDPTAIRLWGTYYGGTGYDVGGQCAVDKDGNVYLTGSTESPNNIASSGAFQQNLMGTRDAFLAKFNAVGMRQWGTYLGGGSEDVYQSSITVDKSGNIYFAGQTASTSGIASPGAHQTVYGGGLGDCFLEKFNPAGARLWGTYYGGADDEQYGGVTTDQNRNVFLTGYTASASGISTPGSYQETKLGGDDSFLVKFDSNGVRQWGTYYGGTSHDWGYSCAIDRSGNVYFSGCTSSNNNIASPGAFQTIYRGGGAYGDAFLAKFTTGGQRLWATYYGGSGDDIGEGCTTDSASNVILFGFTDSPAGIASPGSHQTVYGGGFHDAFIAKFDSSGQRQWGTYYGGEFEDEAYGCAIGWNNEIFMAGYTGSHSNISTPDSYQPVMSSFAYDAMLIKFNAAGQRQWGTYYGGTDFDYFWNCSYISDDTIYAAGDGGSTTNIATPGAWQPVFGGGVGDNILIKFIDCWHIDTAGPMTGPVTLCKPSTGVSYSIPALVHAANYTWTTPTGITISSGAGTTNVTLDIGISAVSGWLFVTGFNKCGDPGGSDSLYLTINPVPVPVISGPNNTCAGTGKVYTTDPGKSNYQWSISAGGVITSGGTPFDNTVTVTWDVVGTEHVYLNYTDANGCSAQTSTDYIVQVTPSPAVNISITTMSNNVCEGTLITFNSAPLNEGGNPTYQWQVNGINSGINFSTFSYFPLNNDVVRCILTSSVTGCIMNNPDTSNEITMIVNPNPPVGITITALPNPPVCPGTAITFTAHPVNEGNTPAYQWKVNGINAGTNLSTYSYIPAAGDLVSCILTSSETCTTNNPASSIQYPVSFSPILPVSVSITPTANPFCAGSSVTFTATPTFGGTTPSYQWKVNGANAGANSDIFTYNPANNDQVVCILTSSETCTSGNPASSIIITMVEYTNLPAGASITAIPNPFCPGSSVTCTAAPTNGGPGPAYQWKVNGINVGINSNTYTYNPVNGDSVRCIMTSTLACITGNPVSSNKIIMNGSLAPIVTFTSCFDTITTINAKPIKLKGGIPLGGTYSGPGVNSLTGIYTPSIAGPGTHTITYSYTNAELCSANASVTIVTIVTPVTMCGNPLTDVRDNRVYQTLQIGTQCWIATNLNFGTTIASTQDQRDNCINEKYCYNDNPVNCTSNGGLYQWDEVMKFDDTPAGQGFCPPGWHIPTENEWDTLFTNWTNSGFAGSPLKYSGYSGFNALMSGARHINKGWDFQGFATFFWSSTLRSDNKAWAHGMNDPDPSVSFYPSSRVNAFSVRCLKD